MPRINSSNTLPKSLLFLCLIFFSGCGGEKSGGGNTSNNNNVLAKEVLIVEKDTAMTLDSVKDNTFTYSYSGSSPKVQSGDILISEKGGGYLKKVISVQDQSGTLIVNTEQASLTDAFEELHLQETITLDGNIKQKGTQGIERQSAGTGGSVGVKIANFNFTGSDDYDVSFDDVDFNFTPTFDIIIDISGGELKTFKLEVKGDTTLNMYTTPQKLDRVTWW